MLIGVVVRRFGGLRKGGKVGEGGGGGVAGGMVWGARKRSVAMRLDALWLLHLPAA